MFASEKSDDDLHDTCTTRVGKYIKDVSRNAVDASFLLRN